jgi:glycosyltransferase involved in cell wall biosynthesis
MALATSRRLRILYLVYWGAAEPLGQSLVLPAVTKLARLGAEITLVTFEKPRDLLRVDELAVMRSSLAALGVRWIALRYHQHPRISATALDMAHGLARSLLVRLRARPDVIHARTFIGGLIGHALASLLRVPWIYHNEGFYPDEQVDGGIWREGSRVHRLAQALERRMYGRADGIIALSHRARPCIEALPAVCRRATPVIVVPSCVDLDHFQHSKTPPANVGLELVYVGSIGGRYLLGAMARFAAVAVSELGAAHLKVLSRSEPALVESLLRESGLSPENCSLDHVPHSSIPCELASCQAGLFFLKHGCSEHGCSPTKVGEYWASGLPVVTTPNVSDNDAIIERERVGVCVREHCDEDYRRTVQALRTLLADPDLRSRCRRAAEAHYALDPACARQMALYQLIVSRGRSRRGMLTVR